MLNIDEYRQIRKDWFGEGFHEATARYKKEYKPAMEKKMGCTQTLSTKDFARAKEMLERANVPPPYWAEMESKENTFEFAPLPEVKCQPKKPFLGFGNKGCNQQEGKTPMRYNEANAIATITSAKSDIAVTRDYFLLRLDNAQYPKSSELEKMFNLYADNTPKNFEELIEAIKGDKFKITDKAKIKLQAVKDETTEDHAPYFGYGPMYGFEWDGPKADHKGFAKARAELEIQLKAARDTIMAGDAAAMKAAVEAFEAWTPTSAVGTAS